MTLDDLTQQAKKSPLHSAAYLQLFGMLHADATHNEARDRLFERSLVELSRISPDSENHRYFTARALAYLGRRPAAIAKLGDPTGPLEQALLSALNGNLPTLLRQADELGTGPFGFFAWHDVSRLETDDVRREKQPEILALSVSNPRWRNLIIRALAQETEWAPNSSQAMHATFLQMLGSTADIVAHWLRSALPFRVESASVETVEATLESLKAYEEDHVMNVAALSSRSLQVTQLDFIHLLRGNVVDDLIWKIRDDIDRRKLPNQALERIEEYSALLDGHPEVELLKGQALHGKASKLEKHRRADLLRQSHTAQRNGLLWTGRETALAERASWRVGLLFMEPTLYANWRPGGGTPALEYRWRHHEWPLAQEYWYLSRQAVADGAIDLCLEYEWSNFRCLEAKIRETARREERPLEKVASELLADYEGRFEGHSRRQAFATKIAIENGREDDALDALQRRAAVGTRDWSVYYSLGRALRRQGKLDEMQRVLLSYPGFTNPASGTRVQMSNYATNSGSWLFWMGQTELAKPLLKIAAKSRTGSEAQYSAEVRLAFIEGDLDSATDATFRRARRYGGVFSLRDAMQLMFMQGGTEEAWQIFDQYLATIKEPQLWSGPFVGHRVEGAKTQDISDWITSNAERMRSEMFLQNQWRYPMQPMQVRDRLSHRYMLMTGLIDRQPTDDLLDSLRSLLNTPKPVFQETNHVSYNVMRHHHDPLMHRPNDGPDAKKIRQATHTL